MKVERDDARVNFAGRNRATELVSLHYYLSCYIMMRHSLKHEAYADVPKETLVCVCVCASLYLSPRSYFER